MKVIVQNIATEYQDEGSGPVILFLHGWQDTLHTFDALAPLLVKDGKRVIRLDLPGFGNTEKPQNGWSIEDYVLFVESFIQKIGVTVLVLVGHSFGGRITLKGVGTKKLLPDKIILIGAAGIIAPKTLRRKIMKVGTTSAKILFSLPVLNRFKDRLRKKLYTRLGSDYYTAGPLSETYTLIIAEDLQAYAKEIIQPALLIWGKNDTETPVSYGERFHSLIKNSRLEIIGSAGHFVHREKPEEVFALMKEFI